MSELFDSLNVSTPHASSSQPVSSQQARVYWHALPSPSLVRTAQDSPTIPLGTQAFLGELRKLPFSDDETDSSPDTRRRRKLDAGHTGKLRRATPSQYDSQDAGTRKTRRSRYNRTRAPACRQILEDLNAVLEQSLNKGRKEEVTLERENSAPSSTLSLGKKRMLMPVKSADDVFREQQQEMVEVIHIPEEMRKKPASPTRKPPSPARKPPSPTRKAPPPSPSKKATPPSPTRKAHSPTSKAPPSNPTRKKSSPIKYRVLTTRTNTPDPPVRHLPSTRIDLTKEEQVQFVSQRPPSTQTVRQPGLPRTQRTRSGISKRSPSAPFRPPTKKSPIKMPSSDDSFGLDEADDQVFDSLAKLGY